MSFWDFTRSPASARLLVDFGDERGVPHATLLAGTGLANAQLDDPKVEVTAAQELRLTGNLLRALGRAPGLGFEVGLRYHFSFAPIRVDIATPVTQRRGDAPFQIYVSLGQSF